MLWPIRLSDSFWLMLILALALGAQQPAPAPAAPDQQAQQILSQARAAAGNASAVQNLRSLEVDLVQHRLSPMLPGPEALETPELDIPVTLQFQLPQGFRKTVQSPPPIGQSGSLQRTEVVNGNDFWVQGEAGQGNVFYFRRRWAPAGKAAPPEPPMGRREIPGVRPFVFPAQQLRNEAIRDLLMLTLGSSATRDLQWRYVGTATARNGQADVLDATGPNGFAARLFFDHKTHRLVRMSYPEIGPHRIFFRMRTGRFRTQPERGPEPPEPPSGEGILIDRGPMEMPPHFAAMSRPPLTGQVDLYFSDDRAENGVTMPHRIVKVNHGRPVEEWIVRSVRWNPAFPASTFERPSHAPGTK